MIQTERAVEEKRAMQTRFLVIILVAVVICGLIVDRPRAASGDFLSDISRLDQVTLKIHQSYVEDIDSKKLVDNAVSGMLKILDPHTSYFEPKEYNELMIHTEGRFGGLGIQIAKRDGWITVMTPISGTPAAAAGIQTGDQIIKINGKSTRSLELDAAVNKLRGEPETEVTITIMRMGEPRPIDYVIVRKVIHIHAVPFYGVINDSIGYIRLNTFSQESGPETEKAIKELLKKNIKGMVYDLRYNPGGLLPQAIDVASQFLPRNSLVVSTRGRSMDQNREYKAQSNPVLPSQLPLVVLVNRGSASASEIVSGAIQDWDRGIVLGDTTFGKGSVQSILPLDPTHHLKLTTAFYYTPSGRCINKPENGVGANADQSDNAEETDSSNINNASDSLSTDSLLVSGAAADSIPKKKTKITDTTSYRTQGGRIVRGGGGIIPDTIVDMQIIPQIVQALFVKSTFFNFANHEYLRLKAQKVKITATFAVTDEIMKDFRQYLDSTKFTYKTYQQLMFDDFKKKSALFSDSITDPKKQDPFAPIWNEAERAALKRATTEIEMVLATEGEHELVHNDKEIRKFIRESLLEREFGQDNEVVYRNKLASDVQVLAALQIMKNRLSYAQLLQPYTGLTKKTTPLSKPGVAPKKR